MSSKRLAKKQKISSTARPPAKKQKTKLSMAKHVAKEQKMSSMAGLAEHQLPVVQAQDPAKTWYNAVQIAVINSGGVFAITNLSEDLTWEIGSKLSRKVLKAYMTATMHSPWELHLALDLHKGEGVSASSFHVITASSMESHVDRGLFNIVQMNAVNWRHLYIDFGGTVSDVSSLTGSLTLPMLIVIPGYSLQIFEPKLQAPLHEVKEAYGNIDPESPESHSMSTKVFRCRLPRGFKIHGHRIGTILANSFQHEPAERQFEVIVKKITGETRVLQVSSGMSVGDLKELYEECTGVPSDQLRLIEGGRQLKDSELLGSIEGSLFHAVLKLRGD